MELILGKISLDTIIIVILGIALIVWLPKLANRQRRQAAQENLKAWSDSAMSAEGESAYRKKIFYKRCKEAGVDDVNSPAGRARLVLVAQNNEIALSEEELIQLYMSGKAEEERVQQERALREKQQRLQEIDEKEREFEKQTRKYCRLFGREKLIRMCEEEAACQDNIALQHKLKQDALLKGASTVYSSGLQKEHDWALHGGIASGLAGGAAGVATAMDIQQKNMQIRAENEAYRHSVEPLIGHVSNMVSDSYKQQAYAEQEAEKWRERAENAKNYLLQELPKEDLLAKLKPSVLNLKQSETGAYMIEVEQQAAEQFTIYESVNATVDGCFKAVFWDEQQKVGEAMFVLPYNGAVRRNRIKSICRGDKLECGKEYRITFEAENLWAIEIK